MQSVAFVKRYKETIGPDRSVSQIISGLACSCKQTGDREPQLFEWPKNMVKAVCWRILLRSHTPDGIEWGKQRSVSGSGCTHI